jgi:hypothetical protein
MHVGLGNQERLREKSWAQFKLDFTTAHREFRLTNQTAHQAGFQSDNMMIEQGREETMQDIVDAIAQLATATASDRGTVATLTTTMPSLPHNSRLPKRRLLNSRMRSQP